MHATVNIALRAARDAAEAIAHASDRLDRIKVLDAACQKMTSHKAYGKLLKKAGLPAKYLSGPKATKYYLEMTNTWAPLVAELKKGKKKK